MQVCSLKLHHWSSSRFMEHKTHCQRKGQDLHCAGNAVPLHGGLNRAASAWHKAMKSPDYHNQVFYLYFSSDPAAPRPCPRALEWLTHGTRAAFGTWGCSQHLLWPEGLTSQESDKPQGFLQEEKGEFPLHVASFAVFFLHICPASFLFKGFPGLLAARPKFLPHISLPCQHNICVIESSCDASCSDRVILWWSWYSAYVEHKIIMLCFDSYTQILCVMRKMEEVTRSL